MITERKEKEIARLIERARSCLICGHVRPDADCVGSELALYIALGELGKEREIWMADDVPRTCRFLPFSGEVRMPRDAPPDADVAIVLDTPTPERLGRAAAAVGRMRAVVNIDHHPSNSRWGTYNWVDSGASATAEFIYLLVRELGVEMDERIATCLYAGILTDTGRFCYSNTTPFTHEVAGDLLRCGVSPPRVAEMLYFRNRAEKVRLLGLVLGSLKLEAGGRIAWLWIRREMYAMSGAESQDAEGFINYARDIDGVRVAALLEEQEGKKAVRISLRSRDGLVDVNGIARRFGGGGHAAAAGALVSGDPAEVERRLIGELRKALGRTGEKERPVGRLETGGADVT